MIVQQGTVVCVPVHERWGEGAEEERERGRNAFYGLA